MRKSLWRHFYIHMYWHRCSDNIFTHSFSIWFQLFSIFLFFSYLKKNILGTKKNKTAYSHFSKQRKLAPTKFHKIAQLQLRSNVNWNGVNDLSYKTHVFTFFLVKVCAKLSYGYNDNYRWFTILINDNIEWATIDRKIPRACGSGELKMSFLQIKRE